MLKSYFDPSTVFFPRMSHFAKGIGVTRDRFDWHTHESAEFFLFSKGRAVINLGGENRDVAADDLLYIPPGVRHRFSLDSPSVFYAWFGFYLGPTKHPEAKKQQSPTVRALDLQTFRPAEWGLSGNGIQWTSGFTGMSETLDAVSKELEHPRPDTSEMIWIHLLKFFAALRRLHIDQKKVGEAPSKIDAVRTFLQSQIHRRVSLEELADRSGFHPAALVRSFRKKVGTPPLEWHRSLRLQEARRKLLQGESPSQVAEATGFQTLQHFSLAFKKETGFSPKHWASRAGVPGGEGT